MIVVKNAKMTATDIFGDPMLCSRASYLDEQEEMRKFKKQMKMCKKIQKCPGYGKLMSIRHPQGGR